MRLPRSSYTAGYFSWAAAKSGSDWKNPETSSQTVFDPGSHDSAATIDVTEGEDAASRGETRVDVPTLGNTLRG